MIRAIIFDLGKVILNYDHSVVCKKLAKFCKHSAAEIYNLIYHSDLDHAYEKGKLTSQEFYQGVLEKIEASVDYATFSEIFVDIFTPNPPVIGLIKKLRPNYKLILLSNTNELHFEHVKKKFPEVFVFDSYVLSYKFGLRKPEKGIFQKAIEAANVPPEECLYIDDKTELTSVASELGIKSITYTPNCNLGERLEQEGVKILL